MTFYIAKDLYDFIGHATLKDNIFWVLRVKALFQERYCNRNDATHTKVKRRIMQQMRIWCK